MSGISIIEEDVVEVAGRDPWALNRDFRKDTDAEAISSPASLFSYDSSEAEQTGSAIGVIGIWTLRPSSSTEMHQLHAENAAGGVLAERADVIPRSEYRAVENAAGDLMTHFESGRQGELGKDEKWYGITEEQWQEAAAGRGN